MIESVRENKQDDSKEQIQINNKKQQETIDSLKQEIIYLKEQIKINNEKQQEKPINNNLTTIQQPECKVFSTCNNDLTIISNILKEPTINNKESLISDILNKSLISNILNQPIII